MNSGRTASCDRTGAVDSRREAEQTKRPAIGCQEGAPKRRRRSRERKRIGMRYIKMNRVHLREVVHLEWEVNNRGGLNKIKVAYRFQIATRQKKIEEGTHNQSFPPLIKNQRTKYKSRLQLSKMQWTSCLQEITQMDLNINREITHRQLRLASLKT